MKLINGGVTSAEGYLATGVYAGIKHSGKLDMAMVYSKTKAKIAGTFTTNVVKAAPVVWDKMIVDEEETAQAVVLNSGVANACTNEEGRKMNQEMAQCVADELKIPLKSVLTASTGVIGRMLPMDKITSGIKAMAPQLSDSAEGGTLAAKAIMTTDTVKKEYAVTYEYEGKTITVGGMSKGSGMIHPNMATMLSVITTDLNISKKMLQKAASADIKDSFNMISVDRDTSTNDTFLVMANGLAGNQEITEEGEGYELFCKALSMITKNLAMTMAKDGEGASKLFATTVINAKNKDEARVLAKSVITSNLVKTAVFGSDANWGRILCALGYSGVMFDPENVDVSIESNGEKLQLVENGMATDYSEEVATKILSGEEVEAIVDMKMGDATATAWGCDLSYDYVKINGDYRS